jgi:hypothetical protein
MAKQESPMSDAAMPEDAAIERLVRETRKLEAEARKLEAERWKLDAEERKLRRDHDLAVWQVVAFSLGAAAGFFAAGAAFARLFLG